MQIKHLEIRDFRNIERASLELGPGTHIFSGQNGQGKTNLLDSIAFLASLRSFRGLKSRDLIRRGCDEARLKGVIEHRGLTTELEVKIHPRGRNVWADGKSLRRVLDYFGAITVVSFIPEDLLIFRSSPSDRRLFFDRMMFNSRRSWAEQSARYDEALKQRNALLKQDYIDQTLLEVYDDSLADYGAELIVERVEWVKLLTPPFKAHFAKIFSEEIEVAVTYDSSVEGIAELGDELSVESAAALLRAELKARTYRDRERGFTTVGPHRDDFVATLDGNLLGVEGSQGQQRAFVLALKLTEMELLRELLGVDPILVLDDVSSELDKLRSERLAIALAESKSQVLISTTDPELMIEQASAHRWTIKSGEISYTSPPAG